MADEPSEPGELLEGVLAAARPAESANRVLARARIAGQLFGDAAPGLGRFRVLERLGGTRDIAYRVVGAAVTGDPGDPLELDGRPVPVLTSKASIAESAERMGADTVIVAAKPL